MARSCILFRRSFDSEVGVVVGWGAQKNQGRMWKQRAKPGSVGLVLGSGLWALGSGREKTFPSTTWCISKFKVKRNRLSGQKFHSVIKARR